MALSADYAKMPTLQILDIVGRCNNCNRRPKYLLSEHLHLPLYLSKLSENNERKDNSIEGFFLGIS